MFTTQTITVSQEEKRVHVLKTLESIQNWPYWNEVYLNCVKESPLSYEVFAQVVQTGDASRQAFDQALVASRMRQEDFSCYLPEFQKFIALYTEYDNIGMFSDGVDQIWHAFLLISDRYVDFCQEYIGGYVHHFPCSLYGLYGVNIEERGTVSSCIGKCVPSSCRGNGGDVNQAELITVMMIQRRRGKVSLQEGLRL